MAPRNGAQRRAPSSQPEQFFELGVQGRKTGVTLKDTGARDEHGFQPINELSSPEKSPEKARSDGEQDMDLDHTGGLGPAALLNGHGNKARGSSRLPLRVPQSRSPVKTNLQSPARRTKLFSNNSSPVRPTPTKDAPSSMHGQNAGRKLDFGRATSQPPPPLTNGFGHADEEDDDLASPRLPVDTTAQDEMDDSMALVDTPADDGAGMDADDFAVEDMSDDQVEELVPRTNLGQEEEHSDSEPRAPMARKKTKQTKTSKAAARQAAPEEDSEDTEQPVRVRKRGRTTKDAKAEDVSRRRKRRSLRSSLQDDEDQDQEPSPQLEQKSSKATGRRVPAPSAPAVEAEGEDEDEDADEAAPLPKKRVRPTRNSSGIDPDASAVVVPRGPPLPKKRGLVIKRPVDDNAMIRTRSGRTSIRPLAYWRNEHVAYDYDETPDMAVSGARQVKMVLSTVKEVVRVPEPLPPRARVNGRKRGGNMAQSRRRGAAEPEPDEPDPWELDPGTVVGDAVIWEAEHEFNPPALDEEVAVRQERLAIGADAFDMRPIKDAEFEFAKMLSEPFFGAGVVDLPPGAVKRPKNSRKMYMTFFVHRGKVTVRVNDSQFRVSQGGVWFVPRGNYYSIENDGDKPARIYFSQGCEVEAKAAVRPEAGSSS